MFNLDIPDMKSDECRATILGALMGVDAGAQCNVDLEQKRVAVESTFLPSDFIEALEEVGYSSVIARR